MSVVKILIFLIFLVVTGIALLRIYLRNERVKNATGDLLKALEKNELGFDEVAAELGMRIRERQAPAMNTELDNLNWQQFKGQKLFEKLKVLAVLCQPGKGVIFIAEGMSADVVPAYGGGREVSKSYPCLVHMRHLMPENTLYCSSSMPADKDHQHLLEDLADFMADTVNAGAAVN